MLILIFFAFLAGIFTILSPCILPVLPALLSGSTLQGRWSPFAIILGLVSSFTFFTLTLTAIVHATGLSADVLRYIAIGLITLFGIIMIFPRLSEWFTWLAAPITDFGQRLTNSDRSSGFFGGFIFGIALGLLWTPCAGPILAGITTLVATQSVTFNAFLITLAYSIGAGIPMFLIASGGSLIIQSSKFLRRHTEKIRQFFGFLMILTAIMIAFHWDTALQQQVARFIPPIIIEDNPIVKRELERLRGNGLDGSQEQLLLKAVPDELTNSGKAPELVGIVNWVNSPPLSLKQLEGKVVLIDFWTYSCINCLRTLPYIEKWYADYKDKGFVVIGVHTPEFEFEKNPHNVIDAVSRLGISYPVAQDNDYQTWDAYRNHYWPAHYLIDRQGNLRMVHFGEGGYAKTENAIRELLGIEKVKIVELTEASRLLSPEIYLGSLRGNDYTKEIEIRPGMIEDYVYHKPLNLHEVGLKGKWKIEDDRIIAEGNDSRLDVKFLAKNVYLVLSGKSTKPLLIYLDGKYVGELVMDGDRKYDVVKTTYGEHLLSIKVPDGISAYAFTFGDE